MLRNLEVLRTIIVTLVVGVSTANAETTVIQEDFDSGFAVGALGHYMLGPLDGQRHWSADGGVGGPGAWVDDSAGFTAHTSPNYVVFGDYPSYGDAIWAITCEEAYGSSDPIIALTLEFFAAVQDNANFNLYISPDNTTWTDVTAGCPPVTPRCQPSVIDIQYSCDLTSFLAPAGIDTTLYIRWNNTDPASTTCWQIGLDTITASVTTTAETIVIQEDFDAPRQGNWVGIGGVGGPGGWVNDSAGFTPHTSPYYAVVGDYPSFGDAIWTVTDEDAFTASEPIIGLTLEFFAAVQDNANFNLYISPDKCSWTDVTPGCPSVTPRCQPSVIDVQYSCDLTSYLAPAGIDTTLYIRWNNTDPSSTSCWQIGLDTITATITTADAIPTVSEWGLIVMSLLVLTTGTLVYARRHRAQARPV